MHLIYAGGTYSFEDFNGSPCDFLNIKINIPFKENIGDDRGVGAWVAL